jgi:hypothetical protein
VINIIKVNYLPLFHHFKAIYQFPKYINFLDKIVAFKIRLALSVGTVMVWVNDSSVVNCGFEPRSCRTNEYKIGICYFSTKHAIFKALISRSHGDVTEWNECLPLECCFYELALYIQLVEPCAITTGSTDVIIISSKSDLYCSHDRAELLICLKATF